MSNANGTIKLVAVYTSDREAIPGLPAGYRFHIDTETLEEAQELAARFPKGTKPIPHRVGTRSGNHGCVSWDGSLRPNGVRGAVNETAIKRYRAMVKAAGALGFEIEVERPYRNCFETRESFEAALARSEA